MPTREPSIGTTPPRPAAALSSPQHVLLIHVDIDEAHLANPVVAVGRLLASEAGAFARVLGDDQALDMQVALADRRPETLAAAERWARWALHNAGVRGAIRVDR